MSRRFAFGAFALSFVISGCLVPVTKVEFSKDSQVSGSIHLKAGNKKFKDQNLLIEADQDTYSFQFEETKTNRITVALEFNSENVPEGIVRTGQIQTEIGLSKGKNDSIRAKIKKSYVYLNGLRNKKLHCKELFEVSTSGSKVMIHFKGFHSFSACYQRDMETFNPQKIGLRKLKDTPNFYTRAQGHVMGRDFTHQFIAENREIILDRDHSLTRYLQGLMEELVSVSDSPDISPKVYVINADVLNAFALPGGYIFVFRGLFERAETEDQLVGVLGHELAHVTARHGTRNLTEAQITILTITAIAIGLQIAIEANDDEKTDSILRIVAPLVMGATQLGGVVHLLHKSREAELEADKLGSQYAWAAGFSPWGLAHMFEIFQAQSGRMSSLEEIFSSHPKLQTRIDRVFDLSGYFYPTKLEYLETTEEFRVAQAEMLDYRSPTSSGYLVALAFASQINMMIQNELKGSILGEYNLDQDY